MNERKVIGRDLPDRGYIEIEVEIRDGSTGLSPGFSVTGSIWYRHGSWSGRAQKRNGRDIDAGGQVVDEIRAVAPELEPLLTVHLADLDGKPMHAKANGWYFYSGKSAEYELRTYGQAYVDRLGTSHERAARALNIDPADLPEGLSEEGFSEFCDGLTDHWRAQADAARVVFAALVDGDGVES